MNSKFDRHVLDQISAIGLSPEEVRSVLERLGRVEFGLEEKSTVGDIVEATGADPTDVLTALQLVRGTDLAERYGARLDDHESRLTDLESSSRPHGPSPHPLEKKTDAMLGLLKMQEVESLQRQKQAATYLVVLVVIGAVFALLVLVQFAGRI